MHPQYSSDLQALKDYVTPIARDAIEIPYYEDLDAGPAIMSIFALFFEDVDVGRRAMQRIVKYESLYNYDYAGQVAAMIGEIGIAQRMISHFENSYDKQLTYTVDTARRLGAGDPETVAAQVRAHTEYDAINAGSIAARLSDSSTALRLLKKFEANGHFAAALRLAADIGERTAIDRLLTSIIERGLYAASGGDRLLYTLCNSLLKTVSYNSTLTTPWVLSLAKDLNNEAGEYAACVGKLAAKLGGKELEQHADNASHMCFTKNLKNDGYIINAMLSKLSAIEHVIKTDPKGNINISTLLGILARKQPRFVLKMFKGLESRSESERDMHLPALEILEGLAE